MTLDGVNQLTRIKRDAAASQMQLVLAAVAWRGDFGRPTLFNVAIVLNLHHAGYILSTTRLFFIPTKQAISHPPYVGC